MATSVKVKILSVNHATKTRRDGTHFKSFTGISDDDKIINFTENHGESTIHGEVQENTYYMFLNIQLYLKHQNIRAWVCGLPGTEHITVA